MKKICNGHFMSPFNTEDISNNEINIHCIICIQFQLTRIRTFTNDAHQYQC
mgnify:CR=1 FL=1